MSVEDDMDEIRHLAQIKRHRLAPDMTGSKILTPAAARMVLANLRHCEDKNPEPSPVTAVLDGMAERGHDVPRETSRERTIRSNPAPISAYMALPAGYYATSSRTGNNDYDFWLIQKPETGRWAGRIFVKRIVGGGTGDEMQTFQLDNMQQRLACEAITEYGPEKSRMLFAAEMTRCTDCGRMLTDQASRDAGRGPTCRNKRG